MVPDMPEMVARWIAHPFGFQVVVPDLTPVDEPARPVRGAAKQQLDEALQKLLKTRAVRVWAKEEGEPTFVTPIDCVPKKTPGEFRVIHDGAPGTPRTLAEATPLVTARELGRIQAKVSRTVFCDSCMQFAHKYVMASERTSLTRHNRVLPSTVASRLRNLHSCTS